MPLRFSRRTLLRRTAAVGVTLAGLGAVQATRHGIDLIQQHATWVEAGRPNPEFFSRHASDLQRLSLGASFAPEQFRRQRNGRDEAMDALAFAVSDLGVTRLRLGLRWNRTVNAQGALDLRAYRPMLDYCFNHDVEICLSLGPIRVFRWPEEHVPGRVLEQLARVPANGATINLGDPLADAALAHLDELLDRLQRDYGQDLTRRVAMVQIENEPFYKLGEHAWLFGLPYLVEVGTRLDAAFPDASVLVTSAGRLNLTQARDVLLSLQAQDARFAGRLVSGFDFHYKTPLRDEMPLVRHFDQITYAGPFSPTTNDNLRDSRLYGFSIEVTEGQAEPYGYLTSPGNSATDFRFLILRTMDRVLDPQKPALIRIWGIEELAKRFLRGEATGEHLQIAEIIRQVNDQGPAAATGGEP